MSLLRHAKTFGESGMEASISSPAAIEGSAADGRLRLTGTWATARLEALASKLDRVASGSSGTVTVDGTGISRLDTAGAWMLVRLQASLEAGGCKVDITGLDQEQADLLQYVRERTADTSVPEPAAPFGRIASLGKFTSEGTVKAIALLSFLGETFIALLKVILHPRRLRLRAVFAIIERSGLQALPIVSLLSLLLGVVIAYQGGVQLRDYGANIFVVELVSLTMARELAPMMTAIIVAGRTGSAFTAELGTMKATEEIDALRTLGLPPVEVLVLPRLLGLLVALPLLTLVADAAGILGGMIMAKTQLEVSFTDFYQRLPQALSATSFLIGIGKAPVFALLIAVVGCFEGFSVRGGAEAVGKHTTISVVHSIFLVIVADAVFSIAFSWLGV